MSYPIAPVRRATVEGAIIQPRGIILLLCTSLRKGLCLYIRNRIRPGQNEWQNEGRANNAMREARPEHYKGRSPVDPRPPVPCLARPGKVGLELFSLGYSDVM
jgi:hypothetical protein